MKSFTRRSLISSLTAVAIAVMTLLTSVSGVSAAPAVGPSTIQINSPARVNMGQATGLTGLNVQITYNCPGTTATPSVPIVAAISITVTQSLAQSGIGVAESGDNILASGPATAAYCNNSTQVASVTLTGVTGNFNEGLASVTASITDPTGTTVLVPAVGPIVVRVIN